MRRNLSAHSNTSHQDETVKKSLYTGIIVAKRIRQNVWKQHHPDRLRIGREKIRNLFYVLFETVQKSRSRSGPFSHFVSDEKICSISTFGLRCHEGCFFFFFFFLRRLRVVSCLSVTFSPLSFPDAGKPKSFHTSVCELIHTSTNFSAFLAFPRLDGKRSSWCASRYSWKKWPFLIKNSRCMKPSHVHGDTETLLIAQYLHIPAVKLTPAIAKEEPKEK